MLYDSCFQLRTFPDGGFTIFSKLSQVFTLRTARLTIHRRSHGLPIALCACLIINVYIAVLVSCEPPSQTFSNNSQSNLFIYSSSVFRMDSAGSRAGPSHCKWEKNKPSELSDQCAPWRTCSHTLSIPFSLLFSQ